MEQAIDNHPAHASQSDHTADANENLAKPVRLFSIVVWQVKNTRQRTGRQTLSYARGRDDT